MKTSTGVTIGGGNSTDGNAVVGTSNAGILLGSQVSQAAVEANLGPLDGTSRRVADGTHTLEVRVVTASGTRAERAESTVSNPRHAARQLMVSTRADRRNATPWEGATSTGLVAIYVTVTLRFGEGSTDEFSATFTRS